MSSEFVTVPGIRVVRTLARDAHVERLLVQVDDDGPEPAELIRAIDAVGVDRVARLLAALDRLEPAGLGGVRDVVADALAPAVLLTHRRGTRLAELLLVRERWQAGEAVSLLTPVTDAVARMHDAGVAHGALGAARILVTVDGAEVIGLDGAELFSPGAPEVVREGVDAVARDRRALRELAVDVLERVDGSRASAAEQLSSRVGAAPDPRVIPELLEGLAQLAAAIPVGLDVVADSAAHRDERDVPRPSGPEAGAAPPGFLARLLADWGGVAADAAIPEAVARARQLLDGAPPNRRRLLVGGGAAVAMAGLLLAIIPPAERSSSAATVPSPAPPSQAPPSTPPVEPDVEPDVETDPADAVVTLLARRDACFRELSVLCLEGVDQAGSAALDDDRRALLAMRDGGEGSPASVELVRVRVVERLGDSALVELGPETAPASLLLMRSEAGWRIRDWVAGG